MMVWVPGDEGATAWFGKVESERSDCYLAALGPVHVGFQTHFPRLWTQSIRNRTPDQTPSEIGNCHVMSPSSSVSRGRILLSVPHMGPAEFEHVREAFETNWLSTVGPSLNELEKGFQNLLGHPAVAVSSGTAGLHLALRLVGVGPGDEVVTPSLSFVASATPILHQHAIPILIDSEPETWNLDPQRLSEFLAARARVGRLPKAVVVVHLFGQPARLAEITELCQRYEVALVEDAAESLGSRYRGRHPGTWGDVGVYSFNGNKMITGTTGGLLVTADPVRAGKVRHWSTQARDPDPEGINNYIHTDFGYNYRMSNVVAAIVRGQLEVLPLRVQQRRRVFERYRRGLADLPGIIPQPDHPEATAGSVGSAASDPATFHSRWLSCFLVDEARFGMSAADLIRWLDRCNIEARPVWRPMHLQPLFAGVERVGGEVAESLHRRGVCLPSSSSLSEEDQDRVMEAIGKGRGKGEGGELRAES
jgi:pyridoxal phosphate-dependent aminotransferase EpsN